LSRKITGIRTHAVVDHESGLITAESEEKTFYIDQEPPFVKLYLDQVLFLSDLPKHLNGVLMALLERMPYTGKGFAINGFIRSQVAEELKMTEGSVRNAITKLTHGKLLVRIGTGTYQFNPNFFGRGDWKDIERLRLETVYDYRGRTFTAEVKHMSTQRRRELDGQTELPLIEG